MTYLRISLFIISLLGKECYSTELDFTSHRALINAVISVAQADNRKNFNRCTRNWDLISGVEEKANKLLHEVPATDRAIAVLEVGNVNYARYEIFIISTNFVAHNLAFAPLVLNSAFRQRIQRLQDLSTNELHDLGSPEEDDGDCYFISLRSGSENHGIAIYGRPQNDDIRASIRFLLKHKKLSSSQIR